MRKPVVINMQHPLVIYNLINRIKHFSKAKNIKMPVGMYSPRESGQGKEKVPA